MPIFRYCLKGLKFSKLYIKLLLKLYVAPDETQSKFETCRDRVQQQANEKLKYQTNALLYNPRHGKKHLKNLESKAQQFTEPIGKFARPIHISFWVINFTYQS